MLLSDRSKTAIPFSEAPNTLSGAIATVWVLLYEICNLQADNGMSDCALDIPQLCKRNKVAKHFCTVIIRGSNCFLTKSDFEIFNESLNIISVPSSRH